MHSVAFIYLKQILILFLILVAFQLRGQENFVSHTIIKDAFPLVHSTIASPIYVDQSDFPGVRRAASDLQTDIERVTGVKPDLSFVDKVPSGKNIIIIGTIGKCEWIDELIRGKKLSVDNITGKWESFLIQTLSHPFPNVDQAVVIAGSDKRGTIFGIYELSRNMGVSPWHWWADVPVKKNKNIFIKSGRYGYDEPKVKYRGIFINDEEPALGRWAVEKYGGFNHQFYEKVFELMLRLKANYLWPAMWWASFNSDDPLNAKIADEYGIVMGTTHHEPMNRAHAEWKKIGKGPWNYETNDSTLRQFWREGIERMNDRETIISLGMRGDGDMAMSKETNIALLEKIVSDQRKIITGVTRKDISYTPQLWALYKEVQDYYDQGMRVPDDVTLLLCDDNWGNIRKLPKVEDSLRARAYGVYYHFDYVGGPRNYKWINTNSISRVREQMNLAYQYGANRIWIVNVGDIKPMEFPTTFFLDYAWDPEKWSAGNLHEYTRRWAEEQFGMKFSNDIAEIISAYSKFNARRKPELLSADTYNVIYYNEAENIVTEYKSLLEKTEKINNEMPAESKDAFFQLVLHPVKASANLNELWVTVAKNRLYAKQGRASTNELAEKAKILFATDVDLSHQYNKKIAEGKWNHMMDQTHISYTYWQQPEKDVLPDVKQIDVPSISDMGIGIEGSGNSWPQTKAAADLPTFDNFNQQTYFIDVFNRGSVPFKFTVKPANEWVKISSNGGMLRTDQRLAVSIDWKKIPKGNHQSSITIQQENGTTVIVNLVAANHANRLDDVFIEGNGYVSMEAEHFSRKINSTTIDWQIIPDIGRTSAGVTVLPVTAKPVEIGANTPRLEFDFYSFSSGDANVHVYLSPTLNFNGSNGLRYGLSIDDEKPKVINMHEGMDNTTWEKWVADNIIERISSHSLKAPGKQVLKFWMIDPGVVVQKLVIETAPLPTTYFGPPESYRNQKKSKTVK
jgi:hypothetical protein